MPLGAGVNVERNMDDQEEGLFQLHRNDWESEHFQREIWRLTPALRDGTSLNKLSQSHPHVDLWECRVPSSSPGLLTQLVSSGFFLSDTACEFVFDLANSPAGNNERAGIRTYHASAGDVGALEALVAHVRFDTRFAKTPFAHDDAARFYRTWVRNAVAKTFDDLCIVGASGGDAMGLVTLKRDVGSAARIGVVCTDPEQRGKGIATLLCASAMDVAREWGKTSVTITTQLVNRPMIKVITGLGGRPLQVDFHMYRIGNGSAASAHRPDEL